ncbi:hypothetical protein CVT26_003661 [Gymnopilus dilepis]|uniref:DUF6534 domain-containing protein n=1 Tax=Gymnopilus dilepis TaxID=231916 RepID=A0A409VSN5_9AGAR|nr:hypothetical protein CVT26_003661 [Gymnopilus dilepis]
MEGLGTGPSSALDSTYGSMLIGVLFATFLQGFLTVQTFNYYENYPKDPLRNKVIVRRHSFSKTPSLPHISNPVVRSVSSGDLLPTLRILYRCLDTIHLALIGQSAYHYLITNWGYQPALIRSTWELCVQLTFIGLSSFVCQLFFLGRIWVFSRKNIFIVGFVLAVCLTTLILDIVVTVQILQTPFVTAFGERKGEIIAVFTSGAAADVLIAALLCYYLRRDSSAFEATRSLVGKIVRYTVATGLATSALAIAAIIAYFAQPQGFYFIAIHLCIGRMYTNALLATLNARHKMRSAFQTHHKSSTSDKKETVVRGKTNKYLNSFQAVDGNPISQTDSTGAVVTYTIERITDNEEGDLELSKMDKKTPFSVV